jgi:UDP-N-acetylmuramate: L-alanyl-gamma-D-glutamyl-meso-diaminopimelate ligase
LGKRAQVADNIDTLVLQVSGSARAGDHIVCMSNGSFGGIHLKLLEALSQK